MSAEVTDSTGPGGHGSGEVEWGEVEGVTIRFPLVVDEMHSATLTFTVPFDAARALGIPVILIGRPELPPRLIARTVEEVMAFLAHPADLGV